MRKGFTLIEVMIVIVILGILTAIAIPKFQAVKEAAQEEQDRMDAQTLQSPEEYREELYSAWCAVNPDLDVSYEQWCILEENDMLPEQNRGTR